MATARNRPPLADQADREVTPKTKHYADWLHAQTGADIDAASVQLALALDKIYRASDEYAQMVADAKRARDEAERMRRDAVTAKRREAAQRKLEEAQAALAKLEGGPATTGADTDEVSAKRAQKASKAPAKKASRPAAKNTSTKAPAKKAATKKTAAKKATSTPDASGIDDDF